MTSRVFVRSAVGSSVVLLTVGVASVSAEAAPKPSACKATMSVANPKQNTTTAVQVSKVGAGAKITTVAHYKTTSTKRAATATAKGTASVPYKIGRATKKYRVSVAVTAVKGSQHWSCSTSFVPR